jgi:hypothetical protein
VRQPTAKDNQQEDLLMNFLQSLLFSIKYIWAGQEIRDAEGRILYWPDLSDEQRACIGYFTERAAKKVWWFRHILPMNIRVFRQDILYAFFRLRIAADEMPSKIRRRVWNKRIKLFWNRLWIRSDEFHQSLDMDVAAMLEMTSEEQAEYLKDLARRRRLAHCEDLRRTDGAYAATMTKEEAAEFLLACQRIDGRDLNQDPDIAKLLANTHEL